MSGLDITFNATSGVELYLLGANADTLGIDPWVRLAAGTLITSQAQAQALLSSAFLPDGTLTGNLNFGLRKTFDIQPGGSADDELLFWHVDTTNHLAPVPEPASLAALSMGALAMLRRRKRA